MTNEQMFRKSSDFRVGQRVKLSDYAKRCNIKLQSKANNKGTVIRIEGPLSIVVRPDNYKTTHGYSAAFWEPVR